MQLFTISIPKCAGEQKICTEKTGICTLKIVFMMFFLPVVILKKQCKTQKHFKIIKNETLCFGFCPLVCSFIGINMEEQRDL